MPREASLKEKNLLLEGANSFALGDDSQKGGKNENGRITSPESVSIHLSQCTIYSTNSSFQSNSVNIILLLFSFKHLTKVYVSNTSNTEYHLIFNVSSTNHLAIRWGFFPPFKMIPKIWIRLLGLFCTGSINLTAELHKTGLRICSHSRVVVVPIS